MSILEYAKGVVDAGEQEEMALAAQAGLGPRDPLAV
jgi:hypothetical protein